MAASSIQLQRVRPPPLNARFFTEETPSSPNDALDDFPHTPTADDEAHLITPPWRRSLYQLLEQPTSSQGAFVVHVFTTFLIVASALVTVLETVPAFHSISTRFWFGIETSLVALFTIEYIARCLAWSNTWLSLFNWITCASFFFSSVDGVSSFPAFFGVVDILSVLPYYIELMLHQDTVRPTPSRLHR